MRMKPSRSILTGGILIGASYLTQALGLWISHNRRDSAISSLALADEIDPELLKQSINTMVEDLNGSHDAIANSASISAIFLAFGILILLFGIYRMAQSLEQLHSNQKVAEQAGDATPTKPSD